MDIIKIFLVGLSLIFMLVGTLGGTFIKNYYVRLHFTSVADTVGGGTLLVTLAIFSSHHFTYLLLAAIVIAQGPAVTHLLARGAVHSRIKMEEEKWRSHKR